VKTRLTTFLSIEIIICKFRVTGIKYIHIHIYIMSYHADIGRFLGPHLSGGGGCQLPKERFTITPALDDEAYALLHSRRMQRQVWNTHTTSLA
jgi:hypothetical protein